jgi:fatty acid/phospholipid biosynthesis enzyme
MTGGALKLRRIHRIDRPALCTMIPALDHMFALINVAVKSS